MRRRAVHRHNPDGAVLHECDAIGRRRDDGILAFAEHLGSRGGPHRLTAERDVASRDVAKRAIEWNRENLDARRRRLVQDVDGLRVVEVGAEVTAAKEDDPAAVLRDLQRGDLLPVVHAVVGELSRFEARPFGDPHVALALIVQRPRDPASGAGGGESVGERIALDLVHAVWTLSVGEAGKCCDEKNRRSHGSSLEKGENGEWRMENGEWENKKAEESSPAHCPFSIFYCRSRAVTS